jgi:hypothetical protein
MFRYESDHNPLPGTVCLAQILDSLLRRPHIAGVAFLFSCAARSPTGTDTNGYATVEKIRDCFTLQSPAPEGVLHAVEAGRTDPALPEMRLSD